MNSLLMDIDIFSYFFTVLSNIVINYAVISILYIKAFYTCEIISLAKS